MSEFRWSDVLADPPGQLLPGGGPGLSGPGGPISADGWRDHAVPAGRYREPVDDPEVPEQVYQDAALAQQAAWRPGEDAEYQRHIAKLMAVDPPFRVVVELAYRAGYGQGRDDEAAGEPMRQ